MLLIASTSESPIAALRTRGWSRRGRERIEGRTLYRWETAQGELATVVTGGGQGELRDALIEIDTRRRIRALIGLGYSCALTADLKVGEVCIPETLLRDDTVPVSPHAACLTVAKQSAAENADAAWRFGKAFTYLKSEPPREERAALAEKHGAQWADPDGGHAAHVGARLAVPWLVVRAIVDPLDGDAPLTPRERRHAEKRAARNLGHAADLLIPRFFASLDHDESQTISNYYSGD
jgi:nucleoside phosphorylase